MNFVGKQGIIRLLVTAIYARIRKSVQAAIQMMIKRRGDRVAAFFILPYIHLLHLVLTCFCFLPYMSIY